MRLSFNRRYFTVFAVFFAIQLLGLALTLLGRGLQLEARTVLLMIACSAVVAVPVTFLFMWYWQKAMTRR
jgi:lysylphosphatidylglycerol synthetase-like protein (DUF2156 family)